MAKAASRVWGVLLAALLLLAGSGIPVAWAEPLAVAPDPAERSLAAPGPAERLVVTLGEQAVVASRPFPVDILVTDANGAPVVPDRPVELRFDPPVNRAEVAAGARLQWVEAGTRAGITLAPGSTSVRVNVTVAQAGIARVGPAGAWKGDPRWLVAAPGPAVAVGFDRQTPLQVEAAAPVVGVRVQLYDAYGQPAHEAGRQVRVRAMRDRKLDREVILAGSPGEVAAVTGADGAALLQVQVPGVFLGRSWSLELMPERGLSLASGRNQLGLQVVDVLPTQLDLTLRLGQDRIAAVDAGTEVEVRVSALVGSGTAIHGRAESLRLLMTELQPAASGGGHRKELSGFSYVAAEGGYYSLRLRLTRAGQYSFTAVDGGVATPVVSPERMLRVKPGAAARFGLAEASNGTLQIEAGRPSEVTLRAVDAWGNPVDRVRTQRVGLAGTTGLGFGRAELGPKGYSVPLTISTRFDLVASQPGRYDLTLFGDLSGQVRVDVVAPATAAPAPTPTAGVATDMPSSDPGVDLRAAVRDLAAAGDGLTALTGADNAAVEQALAAAMRGVEGALVPFRTRAGLAPAAERQRMRDELTDCHLALTRAVDLARQLETKARGTTQLPVRQKAREALEAAAASVLTVRNQLQ